MSLILEAVRMLPGQFFESFEGASIVRQGLIMSARQEGDVAVASVADGQLGLDAPIAGMLPEEGLMVFERRA